MLERRAANPPVKGRALLGEPRLVRAALRDVGQTGCDNGATTLTVIVQVPETSAGVSSGVRAKGSNPPFPVTMTSRISARKPSADMRSCTGPATP